MLKQVTSPTLQQALKALALARRPAFTWGSPGVGKSDSHRQVAAALGGVSVSDGVPHRTGVAYGKALLITVMASQLDAVDTRGVPMVVDGRTTWARPEFLPTEEDVAGFDIVILFFDELNAAPQSVQAPLYQLSLEGRLGEHRLPDNVRVFAAGNLETDRAITNRMSTALGNRFVHFQFEVDNDAWTKWALENDVHVAVIGFLRLRPELLQDFDPKSADKAQATPRTWEYVSDILKVCEAEGINGEVQRAMIAGAVGEAVGVEFIGFLRIYHQLPDPASIIMNPDTAPLNDQPDVNYALACALGARATEDNIGRILTYTGRMAADESIGSEFEVMAVKTAVAKNPAVQKTKAMIAWFSDNDSVL